MKSLESGLRFSLSITLILLMGGGFLIGNQALQVMTENFVVSRLNHDAESLLAAMVIEPQQAVPEWRTINQIYNRPLSGHYYVVRFETGDLLRSRSLWDQTLDIPMLQPGQQQRQLVEGPSDQQLLLLFSGYQKGGRNLTLGVAEDMTPIYRNRDYFMGWFAMLALTGLLLLLVVQSVMVRRSFRQLERVRHDIQKLVQGHVVKLSENVPSEVLILVKEFNYLLCLLAKRLERSRNALGNLAHTLKGPLNILNQTIENVDADDQQKLLTQTERLRELIETKLKRARMAGGELSSSRFNPQKELPELIAVLNQMHHDKGLTIDYQIDPALNPFGDREDMLELLGNLLDNGCKWATSTVCCEISQEKQIVIRIEDDGAGLSESEINPLTERGVRLDEQVEGHGLGLAIVNDIVILYQGSIEIKRSERLGGLSVEIRLPNNRE